MRNTGRVAVVGGPLAVPGLEDGCGRQLQLLVGVGRELGSRVATHDPLELLRQDAPVIARELRVLFHARRLAVREDHGSENLVRNVEHDGAEHLNQPPIEIVDEPRITHMGDHARGNLVVETDVEDGIHHPRHRELGAGAAGHEQWIVRRAELLAADALDGFDLF